MYILGINAYHGGASACLIHDGEIIAAVEEERFNRVKYWAGFPRKSIRYCLESADITLADLDHIGVSRDPNAHLYQKIIFSLSHRPHLNLLKNRLANVGEIRDIERELCKMFDIPTSGLRAQIHNVEHHKAHIASSFLVSPFDRAAVLSIDGFDNFVSTIWDEAFGTDIKISDLIEFPHSLGIFYTAVSQHLGFTRHSDEGKVMGLAPYGHPTYLDAFRKIVQHQKAGHFELGLSYFVHHDQGGEMTWDDAEPTLGTIYSEKFVQQFGPPRRPRTEITPSHADMAASLQVMLEEAVFHILAHLHKITRQKNLCLAGGVALNNVINGEICSQTPCGSSGPMLNIDGNFSASISPSVVSQQTEVGIAQVPLPALLNQPALSYAPLPNAPEGMAYQIVPLLADQSASNCF